MKKWVAFLLAVVVGIVSSLATIFILSSDFNDKLNGDENSLSLREFSNVEQIIDKYYLKDYDMQQVQYAGLKAMVASLEDPYSVYYTPEEFDAFNQEAAGEYYGIGMQIRVDEQSGLAVIDYFFEGSPAKEAGVELGDLIVSIDGADVTKKTLQEISLLCIGEKGAEITIGVMRGTQVLQFSMERREIVLDMLIYKMLDDGIGYMRIAQFGGNCGMLFAQAMGFFKENEANGVIIDLRDNPGGFLTTVVDVLDMLLPEGTLVYTEDKDGNREVKSSDEAHIDMPVTLIVNGNTASASEIFAGAVQDFEYGEVVGTTTYGKGVVQVVIPMPAGGGLKITTSEYFTPNGRSINGNGIYPDYYVELPQIKDSQENEEWHDTQLEKAIEVLKQGM